MREILRGSWIGAGEGPMEGAPVFVKAFRCGGVKRAALSITALGVYEAFLNGVRVGRFVMAPGWTNYDSRLQVQTYDVTELLAEHNRLEVGVGKGWYGSRLGWLGQQKAGRPVALLAALRLEKEDGAAEEIVTDASWGWRPSEVLFSDLYDGETIDKASPLGRTQPVVVRELSKEILLEQEGEEVRELERVSPARLIVTPKGETVIDFGQNLTGYVDFRVSGPKGHTVRVAHAEALDSDGNFYTDNLRTAKATLTCVLGEGENRLKPHYTFYGFRYIRLENWPESVCLENFRAVVLSSELPRTGHFHCGHPLVNRLYENIVWGQKGNFLDVPTDCPQRDERCGWTGDAQAFVRTAAYNYNVDRFFTKWLHDLKSEQGPDGGVPPVVPNVTKYSPDTNQNALVSAFWGDAACVCPWQLYVSYGDRRVLSEQFGSMRAWVEYMRGHGSREELWDNGRHYGDWLGLDAPYGSYKGSTDENLIACASFARCTRLLVKAGGALGKDMAEYEALHRRIVKAFQETYMPGGALVSDTQTAHALALYFDLCANRREIAARLAGLIRACGNHLTTGFVGTPYLLHALSQNGYVTLAYDLLLRERFPSWLFSVRQGATTVWEHWDGLREDGTLWPAEMNSFNHYAYGSVGDWLFGVAAGIEPVEECPGYREVSIRPVPDRRLGHLEASVDTAFGKIESAWRYEGDAPVYSVSIPAGVTANVTIGERGYRLPGGQYTFRV